MRHANCPRQNSYLPVLLELISSFGFWKHNKSTGKAAFQRSLFYLAEFRIAARSMASDKILPLSNDISTQRRRKVVPVTRVCGH